MTHPGHRRFDMARRALKVCLLTALAPAAIAVHGTAVAQSVTVPGFPASPAAPVGAPNVIVIMTDDVGFASGSTFGGAIPTPAMDQLAQNGLRYSNFHTNALCSPSRAALLTGRNAHAVGFGGVTDFGRGQPGYNTIIPKSAASVGQIFKMNGYDTAWFGKNHNVPTWQNGPLGPFDQWASGLGFDYFYGFIGGLTDQFHPILVQNNATIEPPEQPDYVLDRDLADHTIEWIRAQRAQSGGRPFLIHYAPGSAHGPLQAPAEWIAKFKGKFDGGWDVLRTETFERQKRLGVIPPNATIAPPPKGMPAWDSLSDDQRKLFARYMEVFAAQLAYCDAQIGRVVDALRESGQLDNTIIIYIQGDNGASPEGGPHGTINYTEVLDSSARRPDDDTARALKRIEEIGGPRAYPMTPFGWTVAMDTPYPYFKTVSSRLGALTNGMVISWPKSILARGERRQFTHLVDVLPTILELAKVTPPAVVNGVKQQPFDGISFAYSIDHPEAPSRHRTQYFEVAGHAALYQDGWLAASPLKGFGQGPAPALDPQWDLYDLTTDSSQTINVAAKYPAKLKALRRTFDAEARRNHVLPISNETTRVLLPESRPEVLARPGRYILYPSDLRYSESTFPNIKNRSWTAEADIVVPVTGGDGVLITEGGRFSGWGLAVLKGIPTFLYRVGDGDAGLTRIAAPSKLAPGPHKVRIEFTVDGVGLGKGGIAQLLIDGKPSGEARLVRTIAFKFTPEGGAVGHDTGTPLVDDYQVPAVYKGELKSVTVDLQPVQTPYSAQK
jgi:arylsulfatase